MNEYKEKYKKLSEGIQKATNEIQQNMASCLTLPSGVKPYQQGKASGLFLAESIIDHYVREL